MDIDTVDTAAVAAANVEVDTDVEVGILPVGNHLANTDVEQHSGCILHSSADFGSSSHLHYRRSHREKGYDGVGCDGGAEAGGTVEGEGSHPDSHRHSPYLSTIH